MRKMNLRAWFILFSIMAIVAVPVAVALADAESEAAAQLAKALTEQETANTNYFAATSRLLFLDTDLEDLEDEFDVMIPSDFDPESDYWVVVGHLADADTSLNGTPNGATARLAGAASDDIDGDNEILAGIEIYGKLKGKGKSAESE